MIKIMKASAGSGKTFNLAKTYIRLILSQNDRFAYRHVLAVTFTNKATDEMKNRILRELYVLSTDPSSSGYKDDFIPLCGSIEALQKKAGDCLRDILHDYGAFAVSTIDRFFQQTLKAFSREIGQFASYQVELDKQSLVNESVDRVLDSLSEDKPELLQWLTRCALDDLEQGNRYNLENKLRNVAQQLKSDEHRALVEEYGIDEDSLYSKESISRAKEGLTKIVKDFRSSVIEAAKAFVDGCSQNGLHSEDFTRNCFNSIYSCAASSQKDDVKLPTDSIFKKNEDFRSWFRKSDVILYGSLEWTLAPLLQSYCGLFMDANGFSLNYRVYETAKRIVSHLSELGIATDLRQEFDNLLKEKNVLSLDESNVILRNIIDGSDAPFIYEKLGVRFENFLLDEFQDTSRIQWDNFMPLLKESDSYNHENLLVGDIKQSIYRWRGSDWKLMASDVQNTFPQSQVEPLDSNYRSLSTIVRFNNGFFDFASRFLDAMTGETGNALSISSIYGDVNQNVRAKDPAPGSVEAIFCNPDDEMTSIYETVDRLHDGGACYGDITILVRDNQRGSEISLALMDKGISVISDDVLHLKSSSIIRQAVSLLSSVGTKDDSIGSFLAAETGINVGDMNYLSLLDLMEKIFRALRDRNEDSFESQTQYVQSFMDYVQDYASVSGNSIDAFLKKWDDADPKISSPADPESVRVMTIHKSKGLEFPYVIFPYSERTVLSMADDHWVRPDVEGTPLEKVADGIYHVRLGDPQKDKSLFKGGCEKEMKLQLIDNINTYYVALTRAVKGMTVISTLPPQDVIDACDSNTAFKPADFSQLLYCFVSASDNGMQTARKEEGGNVVFTMGEMYDFSTMERKASGEEELTLGYPSFPLNPEPGDPEEDVRMRGRLKFSADSVDFFCDEAKAKASARMNGTVLHNILSEVNVPNDLEGAVRRAVECGDLDKEQEKTTMELLSRRIADHPDWFPSSGARILSETSLVDIDGHEYRPDRVVVRGGKVMVVDYKFGEQNKRYRRQVDRYAAIYRDMGYQVEQAAIWYVYTDVVE